jgi:CubicO group peptidase (beta-lactamase class C family)
MMKIMKFFVRLFCVVVLFACVTTPAYAQQDLRDQIARYVLDAYKKGNFHGAILVADDGDVIDENSLEYANYEWDIANTPDTRFRIGSMTEQFTSLLVFQLLDAGELSLSDSIPDHLRYYRKDTGSKVTIAQLLNHRSGIADLTKVFP